MGYKKGLSSPCSFHHAEWDLSTVVHGDDFLKEGPADSLIMMNIALEQNFQVKTEIIGPDAGQQLEARALNRAIRWEETGITWEPDPRHVEMIIVHLGLNGAKTLETPGVKEEKESDRELREDISMIIGKNGYPNDNHIITDTGIQRTTNDHI